MSSQMAINSLLSNIPLTKTLFREVNDITLHVVTAGDEDAPLVVLLHGAPEFWYCWRHHIAPFVDAGYRVLVPDQRGYNRSDKPDGIRPYRVRELSGDIVDLIASTGRESAHVVGHDWGAIVAWDLALRHPDTVDRIGIINGPHPTVFEETLFSNLRQLFKSWYMFFFQLPRIPEWYVSRNNFQWLVDVLDSSKNGTFTDEDIDSYRAAWSQAGALTGMINWYRALFRHSDDPSQDRVDAPTLVIWGEDDGYLTPEMAPKSVEYCADGSLERFPDATHWVHHEHPEQVNDLLIDHLES